MVDVRDEIGSALLGPGLRADAAGITAVNRRRSFGRLTRDREQRFCHEPSIAWRLAVTPPNLCVLAPARTAGGPAAFLPSPGSANPPQTRGAHGRKGTARERGARAGLHRMRDRVPDRGGRAPTYGPVREVRQHGLPLLPRSRGERPGH